MAQTNNEQLERIRKIMLEYKVGYGYLTEDDVMADPNAAAGADPNMAMDPNAAGAMDPNAAAGAADPNAAAGAADPNAAAGAAPTSTDPNAAVPEVNTNFEPTVDPNAAADPNAADPNAEPVAEDAGDDEDVEEINVDDLTDSQEKTEDKVEGLGHKIEKLLSVAKKIEDLEKMIDVNNKDVAELKDELKKRMPTPQEETEKRVTVSEPFGVAPDDFAPKIDREVSATPGDQYVITDKDIEDTTDWATIAKSLDDRMYHQGLKDILDF